MILKITNETDRRIIAGILVSNGYTVKKVKNKKSGAYELQVEDEQEKVRDGKK